MRHLLIVSREPASAELQIGFPVEAEQGHGLPRTLCDLRVLGFGQQRSRPYFLEDETKETSASPLHQTPCSARAAKAHPLSMSSMVLEEGGIAGSSEKPMGRV